MLSALSGEAIQDSFNDYKSEDEWIKAYPDNPFMARGMPGAKVKKICDNCGHEN